MKELPKAYNPKEIDQKWYSFWEKGGFFEANPASEKPPYCIVIPPPNVTGVLHMGHALVNTLQDILIRWKRMSGFETLWVPGTDHAGISTQTVVERHLMRTTGKKRTDFSREEFLKHVWDWKEKNEDSIVNQLKKLGCSCDWSRQRFTMDEKNNQAVRRAFKTLYEAGLIYRGNYLVNWDPVTQTALADDEVEYEERPSSLWHFKYPLKDGTSFARIATTRPETMLGDTAVAVSPKDPRYASLIGKTALLPLMEREIPIIADHHVDPTFGTGMVKITPAHDPNDYQIGINHNLPMINIMTPNGQINENGGPFQGMTMLNARDAVVTAMKEKGLLEKVEPHLHRIGVSYRSKATIEPYLSDQWFVKMDGFAKILEKALQEKRFRLIPKNWESSYMHWVDTLRDWCISRQLWWGHQIPIWYRKDNPETRLCYDGEGLPPEVTAEPDKWEQDPDVLDTWFSSALWPFAALGWPENTPELARFYPNAVLITGHDILFFWVARMICMGEYLMHKTPFPESFLHGLIYGKSYWRKNPGGGITYVSEEERIKFDQGDPLPKDVESRWEKMSKSKGNIIDPLEMIEQFGTDATRMALCASATHAREIDLDRRRFEEFRNFSNKVWNGARFVLMNLDENPPLTADELCQGLDEAALRLEDRWILSLLSRTVRDVNERLSHYAFDQAALEAYNFFWKQFCAYYVEISKPILFGKAGTPENRKNKQKLLAIILCQAVRLLHPMAPFITEELFQQLLERYPALAVTSTDPYTEEMAKALQAKSCMLAPYPNVLRPEDIHPETEVTFELIDKVVYTIRNIRGEMQLPPSQAVDVFILGPSLERLKDHAEIMTSLTKIKSLHFGKDPSKEDGLLSTGVVENFTIHIPLPEELVEKEKTRLMKEKERLTEQMRRTETKLQNPNFLANAPKPLVDKQWQQLDQTKKELAAVEEKLAILTKEKQFSSD